MIKWMFNMASTAKEFYSELPGQNFFGKVKNLGIECLNDVLDTVTPQQPQPALAKVRRTEQPGQKPF